MSEADQILLDLLDDPSFNSWIKGKASEKGQKKWKKWQVKSPIHAEVRKKALKLYRLPFEETKGSDLQRKLEQLQLRIDERDNTYRLPDATRRREFGYHWAVAAGIVLLIAIITAITFYSRQESEELKSEPLYSHVEVGYGEKANLKISDGSRIQMNSNSSLRYNPEQFSRSKMEVWLEGEAYFSIVRDPGGEKRDFIVHTPDGDIRILGTRFNVNTRFEQTGVVLEEGSVEIRLKDSIRGISGKFMLKPGQRAQFSSTESNILVQEVDTSLYTAWLDEKLEFKKTSLKDVVSSIEQIYGISIEVEDTTLSEEKISGSFRNPDLETLFNGLEVTLNLKITEKKDRIYSITKKRKE